MRVTVVSQSERLLGLVRDFAVGLGLASEPGPPSHVAVSLTQGSHETLLHLLTHIALSAAKSGVETSEPVCRVTFHEPGAASEVSLGLKIASFDLQAAKSASSV